MSEADWQGVEYYPYHRVRVAGTLIYVTVHDLRAFSEIEQDTASKRNIEYNSIVANAVFISWRAPKEQFDRIFPALRNKVHEIPFPPMLSMDGAERSPGEFLLYPAATSPHKNHDLLLEYSESTAAATKIVCVGPEVEPQISSLRSRASKLDDRHEVLFRGRVGDHELRELYRTCWAVVIPSRYEAASGPLMEAVSAGAPVLASRIEPIVAQVEQMGVDVVWFDADDPNSLAEAVEELAANYDDYVKSLETGRAWLASQSWQRTARAYLRVMFPDLQVGV